jgi:hypothetical protein
MRYVYAMSGVSNYPPPPPPPPFVQERRRSRMVLGGVIFGFSPLLFSLVASIFVEDALNESTKLGSTPLYTIFTLPIGGVLSIIGLARGAKNAANRNR